MVVGDFPIEVDTLVVGAGPGGYVAAIRAAQLGQKVTIVDKGALGGVCLNVGCMPSKALIEAGILAQEANGNEEMGITTENVEVDFTKVQEWKEGIVKRLTGGVESLLKANNVDIVEGEVYFVDESNVRIMDDDSSQTYTFNHCIIATGSTPIELPDLPYSERVIDSTGALDLPEIPEKLVVVGGGYIGLELGTAYANFGTEVTIIEGEDDVLGGTYDNKITQVVKRRFKDNNIELVTNALAKSAEETENGVKVTYDADGNEEVIEADYVLVTVGRTPNTEEIGLEQVGIEVDDSGLIKVNKQGRTNIENIFAIGDIVPGLPLAHKASYEGKVAAEVISGEKSEVDYLSMPAVVFAEPEIATVGLTKEEAEESGFQVKESEFPYAANGRALTLNESDGFVNLVSREEDGLILGAQIVGAHASDLIAEVALAIEAGMTAEDVALTIHTHPTLAEMTMEAADVALGQPIHTI